jgi:CI repressor-like protein
MPSHLDSQQLGVRLKLIRIELFGISGVPELASHLGIPAKTWSNYERGVTMPGDILLGFIELTSVDPHWLRTGEGSRLLEISSRNDPNSAKKDQNWRHYASGSSVN